MRRATAAALGTMIGTALLVAAKYGAPSATAGTATAIAAGDPVPAGSAPPNASSLPGSVVPATSGTPSQPGGAPSGAAHTTAPPQPGHTTPAGGGTTAPPPPSCSTVSGAPVSVGGPGVGSVTVTIKVCNGVISSAISSLSQSNYDPNAQALPALNSLVPQYYKTNISAIHYSGATYTSKAYQGSLQAAMSTAHI